MTADADLHSIKDIHLRRFADQFQALQRILRGFDETAMDHAPTNGKWSVKDHLAHLARYHEIFQERLTRILAEDCPHFARYRAEEDADWLDWQSLPRHTVMGRLPRLRAELTDRLQQIPAGSYTRLGAHPALGPMTLADWLEFFLVHEGHHMYAIFSGLRSLPQE